MVWLVQNCRSNKCLQFLKSPELQGGLFATLSPLPRLLAYSRPPPNHKSWIRPMHIYIYTKKNEYEVNMKETTSHLRSDWLSEINI